MTTIASRPRGARHWRPTRHWRTTAAIGVCLAFLVASCSNASEESETAATTPSCDSFAGQSIDAEEIGLPTSGATIESASVTPASEDGQEYCTLVGGIHPVNAASPDITFQLNLPSQWNNKALHLGGGGFDGTLVTGEGPLPFTPAADPNPIAQGYATFGSDSGHQGTGYGDASFASDPEARENYAAGLQLKKTHDTVMSLIDRFYGHDAERTYFFGGSNGGREALLVGQKWPQDYDGIISYYPVDFSSMLLDTNNISKALFDNQGAGWLSPDKLRNLGTEVLDACDSLDAVDGTTRDGLVSDPAACDRAFDIATLRCPNGTDSAPTCFSDAQIAALEAVGSPFALPYELANGTTTVPGYPIYEGADIMSGTPFGKRPDASTPPDGGVDGDARQYVLSDGYVRHFVVGDPAYDSLKFNPAQWQAQVQAVSAQADATTVDLDGFKNRDGKLLLIHGTSDVLVSPYTTDRYFDRLRQKYGTDLDAFAQYYVVPGFGHGTGTFIPSWPALTTMDAWVETGSEPAGLTATDAPDTADPSKGSRPLCRYGMWPQFRGGDTQDAASYHCTGEQR